MMHRTEGAFENRANPSMVGASFTLLVLTVTGFMFNRPRQVTILVTKPLTDDLLLFDTQIGTLNGLGWTIAAAQAR